jgi:hypothetical protein
MIDDEDIEWKLRKAIEFIQACLEGKNKSQLQARWLRLATDMCKEAESHERIKALKEG